MFEAELSGSERRLERKGSLVVARKRQLALRLGGGQVSGIVEKLADQATVQIAPDLFENTLGVGTGL